MEMLIGYSGIALFLVLIIVVLERTRHKDKTFSEYATAGRSFGPFFGTMAFTNTWMPGTVFISFAGLAAGAGIIGFYLVAYSLAAVALMAALAKPVHDWGRKFDLRTQADLLGMRYNSKAVRLVASGIGIVASIPWVVLGMQSLALVFSYLSFGHVAPFVAVLISIGVIAFRQIWTVKYGMRGVVISDMVQGIFAYLIGTVVAVGLIVWLLTNGHGFGQVAPAFYTLPGIGSELGPLYTLSIIVTGAAGSWCWPDIFVRLFTANSVRTIKRTAIQSAPLVLIFGTAVCMVALLASSMPAVAAAPDNVWFTAASVGGVTLVTLAAICVVGATLGNIGANLQALGTQTANDIVGVIQGHRMENPKIGKIAVTVITAVCAVGAYFTASTTSGLVVLALISYQGIVQLAPTLLFGIFWKRGNAVAAVASMLSGFGTAAVLQWIYPVSIPWLGGLTSGVAALVVNITVYVICSYTVHRSPAEAARIEQLWRVHKGTAKATAEHEVTASLPS
ncbi:sodium:solute symporter family protein [Arthrobacter sp. B2a2-09]|uniref:sodium:solute symporter family protein n=1 Tax=Arthrobacter sp. B2a2-09 TaxID=2952822 RepID=UPI0022CD88A7|nr:sodium:solute symporter family protein [Arthrobacter sp. B2a2-09]MCZ9882287.1 sodium:solute symporter family protein [Arthrobacter sp. B2a2-09]